MLKRLPRTLGVLSRALAAVLCISLLTAAVQAQMSKPRIVTLSGKVIDFTCAIKHKAMTDTWYNAENNRHKTEAGPKPACAEMCLRGGQPAALFIENRIEAVLACNPRTTLADYAAEEVEMRGYWGGGKLDRVRSFVPQDIRRQGEDAWKPVNCLTMHEG